MDLTSQLLHLAPVDQPTSVHQLAERLFPTYSVDRGNIHLAGCRLENRLFVRLEFRLGEEAVVLYVDADGREVADETVEALGMSGAIELERPPGVFEPTVDRVTEAGAGLAAGRFSDSDAGNAAPELIAAAVLWCKFAEGKLRFSVGEDSVDLPFSGWARTLCPPPFVCPYSATNTFEIAATDDGRIAAASQIAACEETGRRMLSDELATCSVTERRVVPELIQSCPVTDQPVLRSVMVPCRWCDQPVSPAALRRHVCAACRELNPVDKADPRMTRLLEEYPLLDRWHTWQLSETATVYILVGSATLKRLLLVVGKESLDVKRLATGNRLFGGWKSVTRPQYDSLLR
ncbi:MAG: hypothetical protein V3R99_11860 [Thermoguttaceae bacterium]